MSQQGLRQASVRAVSGTTLNYEGDWHAMWDLQSIPAGTFNERMLLYINEKLGASYTHLPGAMQALASANAATNFSSLGTFEASLAPLIILSANTVAEDAANGTFIGTLSLTGEYTGTPVFALDDDAGGKFAVDDPDIKKAGALDYETATSHVVTVSVSNIDPAIDPQDFTINVTNKYDFINSEAAAWVAAFSVEPNDTDKANYDTFVGALKSASIWSKIDALWWMGGPDSQASRINAKSPGNLTLSLVNSPSFTAYRGFTCDGSTSYLRTGYNPSTFSSPQWALNSAHLAVYSLTSGQVNGTELGCRVSSTDDQAMITMRNTSNLAALRVNQDDGSFTPASTDGSGLFVGRRSASNAIALFRNGSSVGTSTITSQAVPNLEMYIGALNQNGSATQFSSRQLLFACVGASLTDQNITDLTNAVSAFEVASNPSPPGGGESMDFSDPDNSMYLPLI